MTKSIAGFLGISTDGKKSKIPALQDKTQSITGLILALFMLCHMLFTSSILFGKRAFEAVVHFAEPGGYSIITNIVAIILFVIFMIHAFLGMRKFPQNYKAYLAFKAHRKRMRHLDTTLWWRAQFMTGFLLFFLASAHLIVIIFTKKITSDLSIARFGQFHWFYIALLIVTVVHASTGMYRLYMKWVSIDGSGKTSNEKRRDAIAIRHKVKKTIFIIWICFCALSIIADLRWLSLN